MIASKLRHKFLVLSTLTKCWGRCAVRIFDHDGILKDSVSYDDISPWPIEPDGNGPTLELISPDLDNTLAESWISSQYFGSPGEENTASLAYQSSNKFYQNRRLF